MASPTLVSVGTLGYPAFAMAPGVPAGIVADDILACFVTANDTHTPAISGWTLKTSYTDSVNGLGNLSGHMLWKRTNGTESDPVITGGITDGGSMATIVAFRGCVATGDPFEVVSTWEGDASANSVTTEGVTTLTADTLLLHYVSVNGGNAVWTHTDGYTSTFQNGNGNSVVKGHTLGRLEQSAVGASGNATLTLDTYTPGKNHIAVILALASIPVEPTYPRIENLSMTAGTPFRRASTPITFDAISENDFGLLVIGVSYPRGVTEVIHNGQDFMRGYTGSRVAITNGWRYTVNRIGGWKASHALPTILIYAVDEDGNLAS